MDNTRARICKAIAEQFGISTELITDEQSLIQDLRADSLDRVEICMAIEDDFGIDIDDDEAEACETVGEIVALVSRLTAA